MNLSDIQRTRLELILRNWVKNQKEIEQGEKVFRRIAWSNVEYDSLMCSIEELIKGE